MHKTLRPLWCAALALGLTPLASAQGLLTASTAVEDIRAASATAEFVAHPIPSATTNFGGAELIYDNGDLNTGTTTGSGTTVPTAGYEWSEVQNEAGNTTESNTLAGVGCINNGGATNNRIADDFTVPAGETWTVEELHVYGYQTGFAGATSPFTGGSLRIWDGSPADAGSTVIFGDATTNRLTASVEAMLYRVFNTTTPPPGTAPGTTRRIWESTLAVSPAMEFTEGTYWVDYQLNSASGFCPSVTIPGVRGLPGWNALQFLGTTSTWTPIVDAGNPDPAPDFPQDLPFELYGSIESEPPPPGGGGLFTEATDAPGGDAPELPGGSIGIAGADSILGTFTAGSDIDCYDIAVTDASAFSASTVTEPTIGTDTQLYLFRASDLSGVSFNDDYPNNPTGDFRSFMDNSQVATEGNGDYIICVNRFDRDPRNAAGTAIFPNGFNGTLGPTAPDAVVASYSPGGGTGTGGYLLLLTGVGSEDPPPPGGDVEFESVLLRGNPVQPGGQVRFKIQITNDDNTSQEVDVWAVLTFDGQDFVVREPRTFTVAAGDSVRSGYYQNVPEIAPAGTYTYTLNAGIFNEADPGSSVVYGSDTYEITVGNPVVVTPEMSKAEYYALTRPSTDLDYDLVVEWASNDFFALAGEESAQAPTSTTVAGTRAVAGPNPFASSTRIAFALEADARVSLVVYDAIGREVATLVSGELAAGSHTAEFVATGLPAGTYVYRLTVGADVQTGRLTLAR